MKRVEPTWAAILGLGAVFLVGALAIALVLVQTSAPVWATAAAYIVWALLGNLALRVLRRRSPKKVR